MSSVRLQCVSVVFNWCSVTLLEGSSVIRVFYRAGIQRYCFLSLTFLGIEALTYSAAI